MARADVEDSTIQPGPILGWRLRFSMFLSFFIPLPWE